MKSVLPFFAAAGMAGLGATLVGALPLPTHRVPLKAAPLARATVPVSPFPGARPSFALETFGSVRRVVNFSSPIQHIVVIVMENRTVDNLFAAYYSQPFPAGGTFGSALNLYDPNDAKHPLRSNSLSAHFDPQHAHESAFLVEAKGDWDKEKFICRHNRCPADATPYSYVPAAETDAYRQLVSNWAFGNNVRQPNEGPSWPAHQYLIAGQDGGVAGAATAPYAQAENPGRKGRADQEITEEQDDSSESADVIRDKKSKFCGQTKLVTGTLDMLLPYRQIEDNNPDIPPCEEYGANQQGTILDAAATRFGRHDDAAWQYISHSTGSIWAAPLGVKHLNTAYENAKDKATQPFAVDPGAQQFVQDLGSANPKRPFAHLTYVTPCYTQSDHPITGGTSHGPEWLAYVVNAIGESKYWPNTAIIVTWDDWGGFFDHVQPLHPFPNAYPVPGSPSGNPSDPYEYGFRVPFIVISPYVRGRAYISTQLRSFSAILHYTEDTFDIPSLNADDAYNDNLSDFFNFGRQPLPYIPVTGVQTPKRFC